MIHTITVIPGDGIGPDIVNAATRIVDASGISIQWETAQAGLAAIKECSDPIPDTTLDSIRKNKIALKGPLTTPVGKGFRSINVALRKEFDLYFNLRPVKSFKGVRCVYENVDVIIARENTEGLYSGLEHYIDANKSAAEMIGIVTRSGSERIVRAAFEYARAHHRKKMTAVHKANILKFTSGLFLDVSREIASQYPDITFEDKIIDNMAMQLVMNPLQFDMIVTTNLFGDILSDLASGLVGGIGLAPGANIGNDHAIFEAVHGSAPDIAGKNIANPCAVILAAVMMLDHIGEPEAARRIEHAVSSVILEGTHVTRDLNPDNSVGTREMADHIIEAMHKEVKE